MLNDKDILSIHRYTWHNHAICTCCGGHWNIYHGSMSLCHCDPHRVPKFCIVCRFITCYKYRPYIHHVHRALCSSPFNTLTHLAHMIHSSYDFRLQPSCPCHHYTTTLIYSTCNIVIVVIVPYS